MLTLLDNTRKEGLISHIMESIETSVSTQRLESRRACANCARAKAKCVIVELFIDTCQRYIFVIDLQQVNN
jgi:hypothetical protein